MPSIKEKCVCQICICGKHHCGEEITFPSLIEATSGEQCKTQTTAAATAAVPGQPILKSSSTTTLLQAEVPQSYDSKKQKDGSGRQQLIEDDTQSDGDHHHQHHHHHQQTTTANSSFGGCEQSRQRVVTTITTLTRKTSQQRQRANKEEEEEEAEENAKVESRMKQQQQTQPTDGGDDEEQQKQQKRSPGDEKATGNREEADSITISKTSSQRKTWQTSPEEVEELTRSLSRLRTDPEHGGYLYEKMVEKEKSKTISSNAGNRRQTKQGGKMAATKQHQNSTQPILISSTTTMIDQPHLVNGNGNHHHHQQQQQYVVKQLNNGPTTTQPAKAEPFLPPLTGFSDSDSSFGSFSCSVEGDHHLLPTSSTAAGGASGDHRQVQCICESLKKSKLEETENFDGNAGGAAAGENGGNINFIDVDDNWIVTRPKRSKPRDNLRLEGPMEMETTFRSTYETTAQRMITDREEEEGSMKAASSKRSTAATSRQGSKGSCGSPSSGGLYLNTRRGRNGLPATPLLRSAKSRRRHTRNRPMTSLKAGGDGYYNTISRDAYKNFIIVNGEAKMVGGAGGGAGGGVDGGHHVKLPKVVTKTTLTTSEEKNRQKFAKSGGGKPAKIGGMEAKMVVAKTSDEQLEKMVMIDGEQIRKFEKKSFIAKSDGGQEVTDVERKIIRKVKCAGGGPKDANGDGHKEDDEEGDEAAGEKAADHDEQPVGTQNYTIDTISGAPRRPFHARYQDNIRELGLLDRSDEAMAAGNMADTNYRHTTRRLHETSKDFNLQMPASPGPGLRAPGRQLPKTRPEVKVKLQSEAEALKAAASSRPSRMVANGSHVMARPAHKPFILPQRIHRHKNECSVNVFEGDIDFTTTNRWAYGDVREGGGEGRKSSVRVGSAQRKRTAGRRYLKSSKRRNLFRQSSDSMFSSPGQGQETGAWAAAAAKESSGAAASTSMAGHDHAEHQATITSTYQKNFDDRLYCPALDVACQSHNNNNNNNSENFKYTGEAGGHKYYLSSNYS